MRLWSGFGCVTVSLLAVCACVCVRSPSLWSSLKIGRNYDSSSRMSRSDSEGLLQRERASSDNLSSSLGDDSLPSTRTPKPPGMWKRIFQETLRRQRRTIKTRLLWWHEGQLTERKRVFLSFVYLFCWHSIAPVKCESGWQALCINCEEAEGGREKAEGGGGKLEFADTDTDGIVFLWPRLDFQSLTCCNPRWVSAELPEWHRLPSAALYGYHCPCCPRRPAPLLSHLPGAG